MSTQSSNRLDMIALGWALSAALVVLFAACLAAALALPEWSASHAWIGLFSAAPVDSVRVWVDGIVFSIAFGWIAAIVLALTYNRLLEH